MQPFTERCNVAKALSQVVAPEHAALKTALTLEMIVQE
jgi:hypothetical protein